MQNVNVSNHGANMQHVLGNTISIFDEVIAYETLWGIQNETLRTISTMFKNNNVLPTQLLKQKSDMFETPKIKEEVTKYVSGKKGFSVSVHGDFQYPMRLQEAKYPIELFYYKGDLGLLESPSVSVVGARQCSEDGKKRTRKLVLGLVEHGYTIVSGLAMGVDTVALSTAIEAKGNVIGVIGTPIDQYYPKENKDLQDKISSEYLLISQVPFYRYHTEPFKSKRNYFPQRNETMSALSEATIIVEASDTSGTLTQARAALAQGRKLFILNSCFDNKNITWPKTFEGRGAIRVNTIDDITNVLVKRG
jgi:DNA processing protein